MVKMNFCLCGILLEDFDNRHFVQQNHVLLISGPTKAKIIISIKSSNLNGSLFRFAVPMHLARNFYFLVSFQVLYLYLNL